MSKWVISVLINLSVLTITTGCVTFPFQSDSNTEDMESDSGSSDSSESSNKDVPKDKKKPKARPEVVIIPSSPGGGYSNAPIYIPVPQPSKPEERNPTPPVGPDYRPAPQPVIEFSCLWALEAAIDEWAEQKDEYSLFVLSQRLHNDGFGEVDLYEVPESTSKVSAGKKEGKEFVFEKVEKQDLIITIGDDSKAVLLRPQNGRYRVIKVNSGTKNDSFLTSRDCRSKDTKHAAQPSRSGDPTISERFDSGKYDFYSYDSWDTARVKNASGAR